MPGRRAAPLIDVEQAISQSIARALNRPVAWEPVKICLHSKNAEGPCTRARESVGRRHRNLEQSSGSAAQARVLRAAKYRTQGPQCTTMAIFRPCLFQPLAIVAEEIPESSRIGMERQPEECQVALGEVRMLRLGVVLPALIQLHRYDQGAGVVV